MTYHNTESAAEERFKGSKPPPKPPHSAPITGVTAYVVEYDLPSDFRRKRFYRRIRRYFQLYDMDPEGWSTSSVVVTENRDFAWYVWREARNVGGVAHIYEGHQLDVEP